MYSGREDSLLLTRYRPKLRWQTKFQSGAFNSKNGKTLKNSGFWCSDEVVKLAIVVRDTRAF